jgi:hypothetical protein
MNTHDTLYAYHGEPQTALVVFTQGTAYDAESQGSANAHK